MCPGRRGCPAGWRPVLCTTLVMLGPLRPPSEPCTAGCQTVLVGCYDRHLYCLDFSDGAIRWKVSLGGMIKCSALVLRETLLCGSYESNLVVRLRSEDGPDTPHSEAGEWKVRGHRPIVGLVSWQAGPIPIQYFLEKPIDAL